MLEIHVVTTDEISTLLSLIRALANYEKKPHKVVATEADLARDLFGPRPKFRALIAEWGGKPVGYASFFYFYSTYEGRAALFLEDLFVLEEFRKHGIGKTLLGAVAKLALDEGCFGLRWEVLDWNRPAVEFYEKLGANFLHERKAVAFDQEALRRVSAEFSPQGHRDTDKHL
jgi:GNAT superfamily N-acetyltransferase